MLIKIKTTKVDKIRQIYSQVPKLNLQHSEEYYKKIFESIDLNKRFSDNAEGKKEHE